MTTPTEIRRAGALDYDVLADVMFDAVRHSRSPYTSEQLRAWVPSPRTGDAWIARLNSQLIFVAEQAGSVIGFMSLAQNGYIDFAYIRPSSQGTGVFRQLFQAIESQALTTGEHRLWVHASLTAQPAFTAMGFSILQKETVEIGGQILARFEMEKRLAPPEQNASH